MDFCVTLKMFTSKALKGAVVRRKLLKDKSQKDLLQRREEREGNKTNKLRAFIFLPDLTVLRVIVISFSLLSR